MSRAKDLFSTPVPTTTNRDGYAAYSRDLEEQYLQTLLTNTVSNTFYADKNELLKESDAIHDQMLKKDPEFAAKALGFARNEGFMKMQPTLGLAKLSNVDKELFKAAYSRVVLIPSDLQDLMTMISGMGRGEGGRAIKTTNSKFLNNRLSEYWAIKYNGRGRGYAISDIIATSHPKPINAKQEAIFRYLTGKDYDKNLVPQIAAYEALKSATTDADRIRLINEGRLPHEVVTGVVSAPSAAVWEAILANMPVFAMLRNLNTMDRVGILDKNKKLITDKLTNVDALSRSKILPFRFLTAMKNVSKPWVQDVLRMAIETTANNLPEIPGKSEILLDVSGSMNGEYLLTGSIFALAMFKKADANFHTFDTSVYDPRPSKVDSILTQAERIRSHGGTDTGVGVRRLTAAKEVVDNIIMITDEQQNTGSSFYSALTEYRRKVNPNAKAFVIDIAPYRTAMIPPTDKNSWYIYGWSDQVISYVSTAAQGFGGMVEKVKNMTL